MYISWVVWIMVAHYLLVAKLLGNSISGGPDGATPPGGGERVEVIGVILDSEWVSLKHTFCLANVAGNFCH